LENKGLTLAVLGCGLDIVYPPENREIMARIIQEGSIISECPPGTKPFKSYFPARNRIISGLSDCVAVMEASKKSGTMITAGYAGEQGRDLFAVPGSIFSTHSDGTNQLIQDGACVLTNVEDMLWKIPFQKIQNIANIEKATKSPSIQDILLHTEKSADEIAEDLGMSVSEASGMLSFMELSGEIIFQNGRFSLTDSYKYSINYNEQRNMHC
jgi:DNA processing protein